MTSHRPHPQPAGIWSPRRVIFDKEISLTQNLLLSQGETSLLAMMQRIHDLYDVIRATSTPGIMNWWADARIPFLLSEICTHQGEASSLLFNGSERGRKESAIAYNLRLERFRYVSERCRIGEVDVTILTDRKVRNRLTHIDSYLATIIRDSNTGIMMDATIAYRDQFTSERGVSICFSRTFVVAEEVILHLGTEIAIRPLFEEARGVIRAVFGNEASEPPPPLCDSLRYQIEPPLRTEA